MKCGLTGATKLTLSDKHGLPVRERVNQVYMLFVLSLTGTDAQTWLLAVTQAWNYFGDHADTRRVFAGESPRLRWLLLEDRECCINRTPSLLVGPEICGGTTRLQARPVNHV